MGLFNFVPAPEERTVNRKYIAKEIRAPSGAACTMFRGIAYA